MGIMTGVLADFRKNGIDNIGGRVIFTPRGPDGTADGYLLSTVPLVVNAGLGGVFSTNLIDPENTVNGYGFDVVVEWLDAAGGYIGRDYFGVLYPPPGGGRVVDYLQRPGQGDSGSRWWVEPTPPDPWPNGVVWVDTTTWNTTRKVA